MTSPNLQDLEPGTPEYEAALEAAQAAEDAAHEASTTPQGERPADEATTDKPAEAEASDQPAETEKPASTEQPAATQKVDGVASKDGKRVLPYSALKAARRESHAERQARLQAEAERDAALKELQDLKAGKKPDANEDDAKLDELAADIPATAPLVKRLRAVEKQLTAKAAPEQAARTEQDAEPEDPVQEAIDAVPLLATWQAEDQEKFNRAKAIDASLMDSPKWKGKSLEERFAHVARQVVEEYDLEIEADAGDAKPTPSRKEPEKVVQDAKRQAPTTLSDFKCGAPENTDAVDRLPPQKLLARMQDMTDEEIDAHLAKFG